MLLSDFSIRRPVSTVVIIIALMCLGLLALRNLRVNQIPGRAAAGDGGEHPVSGRLAGDRRARGHRPHREGPAEHLRRSTRSARPPPRAARRSSSSSTSSKNMVEAADEIRNAIATVRYKLPLEMREPVLQRIDPSAQPMMQLALSSRHAEPRRDLAPRRGRCSPTASAGIDGVAVVDRERLAQPRAVGAAARARSCASTTSR